jgi:hypothetical protein
VGVSGVGIFSDDNAADLRGDYRHYLSIGIDGPAATDRLLKEWAPVGDPDLEPVFWLALAVTQWKVGRLESRVKQEAIRVIDDASALRPWGGSPDLQKRTKVLSETRALIESPQPEPVKIRKRTLATCDWQPGDLIAYRLQSGPFVVFRMCFTHTDQGGTFPECQLLDWLGPEPPTEPLPPNIGVRETIVYGPDKILLVLPLGKASVRKKLTREGRLIELGMRHPAPPKPPLPISRVILDLDRNLSEYFDLR